MPETDAPAGNVDFFGAVKSMVLDNVTQANAIVEKVKASRVDVKKLVHDVRTAENPTDEKVKAYQAWEEKLLATLEDKRKQIDSYIKESLPKSEMSDEEFEAAKAQHAVLKSTTRDAKNLAAKFPGYTEDVFADVPALLNIGGSATTSDGNGPKRPRLASITVNGNDAGVKGKDKDGNDVVKHTFTGAASIITADSKTKVLPSELQAVAFEVAKTDDLSTVNSVEFNYSAGGKEYAIVAIPATPKAAE